MSSPLPHIDFSRIREHDGSQSRSWEELCFLLTRDIEGLPAETRLERRAAPDGGIEFSCPAPAGRPPGRWAWQAKYLFDVDSDAIDQMRKSFRTALKTTPDLTRYTFVLPTDRSATAAPRTKSGLAKWQDAVARWTREANTAGRAVEIEFRGHSEVLAALQRDHHAGAVRYFFDKTMFTTAFFRKQVEREVRNLGERYDPDVNVEVDVGAYLDAVSRTPAFQRQVMDRFDAVDSAVTEVNARAASAPAPSATLAPLLAAIRDTAEQRRPERTELLERFCEPVPTIMRTLGEALDELGVVVETAERGVTAERDALPPRDRSTGASSETGRSRDALDELLRLLRRVESAVDSAASLLRSSMGRAADVGAVLLVGPAGCGKSHLLADAARNRVADGMPTLLLLGQHLVPGLVWPQVAAQLDVNSTGELLGALSIAAQLRGEGRALILVDAINEGAGADIWPSQLAGFLADCADHPWVAVVLALRDIYRQDVVPDGLPVDALVEVHHPGLAGHEEEALTRYTQHYGLRMPDIPALLPELANPLFLRTMCRSVKARGLVAIPREAASLSWLFEGLVLSTNTALSHRSRLDRDVQDNVVGRAVAALAETMLDADDEALPYDAAWDICLTLHPDTRYSRSLLAGLLAEGLLLRERVTRAGQSTASDQVRFTYQRMADHLRAEALLERHSDNRDLGRAVKTLTQGAGAWRRHGLLDALVLLVGERRDTELALLLNVQPTRRPRTREATHLQETLADGFLTSLLWRDPRTLDSRALRLLDGYLHGGFVDRLRWLELLLTLACVPGHPLNAGRLDTSLRRLSLPERDEHWTNEVLSLWAEHNRALTRTIDWAWDIDLAPPSDVTRLTATALAWLLSSPNRRLRDTATKALLNITLAHTDVLAELVERFASLDDPYIVERVLAVACGHVIRHRDTDTPGRLDALAALASATYQAVFDGEVPEHLLVRHYASTVVQTVADLLAAHGRELSVDLARTRPPYSSAWPLTAPSKRDLAPRYGRERSKSKYLFSIGIRSDFERYVIESDLVRSFVLPNQARRQAAVLRARRRALATARAALVESLPPRRRRTFSANLDAALSGGDNWRETARRWKELEASLGEAQVNLLHQIRAATQAVERPGLVRPDKNLLARWIATRVLELGWTPEKFEDTDKWLSRARSSYSEVERFGKKYAWIGFYQLAGHLADHCTMARDYSDAPAEPYRGPWQLGSVADIDPSVVLRGDEPPEDSPGGRLRAQRLADARRGAWWLSHLHHELSGSGTDGQWLRNTADGPDPLRLLTVSDPEGAPWTPLSMYHRWSRRMGPATGWRDDQRELVLIVESHLVPEKVKDELEAWLTKGDQDWSGSGLPGPPTPSVNLLRAYPDADEWPERLASLSEDVRAEQSMTRVLVGTHGLDVAPASLHASSKSSRDFSATDLRSVMLPAPALYRALRARWIGDPALARALGLGRYEREFAWVSGNQVVAFTSDGQEFSGPHLLLVREASLRAALAAEGLCLLTTVYAEKIFWRDGEPHSDRAELHAAAVLTGDGRNVYSVRQVLRRWDGSTRTMEPLA